MRLRLLICLATLATSSFSMEQEGDSTSEISIAYKVLEVFPKACRVLITCHSPHAPLPITYSLWGTGDTEVAKKTVKTQDPASFSINVTLKSRPDLLTYFCQAATTGGKRVVSTKLQMYWELWARQLPQGPTFMLAGSLTSIAAITSWMLGWTKWTRL